MDKFLLKTPKNTNENSRDKFLDDVEMSDCSLSNEFSSLTRNILSSNFGNAHSDDVTDANKNLNKLTLNVNRKRLECTQNQTTSAKVFKTNSNQGRPAKLLPIPFNQKQENSNKNQTIEKEKQELTQKVEKVLQLLETSIFTGNVNFAIKIHKSFPNRHRLYEIFSRILKIDKGKFSTEKVILLRDESGPVLQTVYYDFDGPKIQLEKGNWIRCVGRFIGEFRVQIFKISTMESEVKPGTLTRFQNISNFILNKVKTN